MLSPFDLAAAQPILGQPSKKKWMPSPGTPFGRSNRPNISGVDVNGIAVAGISLTIVGEKGNLSTSSVTDSEVVAVTFSRPTSTTCFEAFEDQDLEKCGRVNNVTQRLEATKANSFGIDMPCPPRQENGITRMSELSLDGSICNFTMNNLVNAASERVRCLSWKNLEKFDQSNSGMELLVRQVGNRELRKKRLYSAFALVFTILVFSYILLASLPSEENHESGVPDGESSSFIPKFLIPTQSLPQP